MTLKIQRQYQKKIWTNILSVYFDLKTQTIDLMNVSVACVIANIWFFVKTHQMKIKVYSEYVICNQIIKRTK